LSVILAAIWFAQYTPDICNVRHHHSTLTKPEGDKRSYFINNKGLWIFTRLWKTRAKLQGLVFVVHDVYEHSGVAHYRPLVKKLNEAGYSVFTLDNQGHGRSNGERGYFESFNDLVDDLQQYMVLVMQNYPNDTPFFIMGHGFGGLVAIQMGK